MNNEAERRFFLFLLPAMMVLVIPLLACGAGTGGATVVEECRDSATSDACSTCCSDNGHSGHLYNSFSDPPCECM